MSGTAARQLNISNLPEATEYTLCSLAFLGKRKDGEYNPFTRPDGSALPRSMVKILSCIWTAKKNFGKNAEIRKADFSRKCGLSGGAISAGLEYLTTVNKLIEETKPNVYNIIPKVNGQHYFVYDNYLHSKKFDVTGKVKKLSQSAVTVLDYIKAFYMQTETDAETGELKYKNYNFKSREIINYFEGSEKSIAKHLNLPKSTVSDALNELIAAGLLYRNKRLRYKDEAGHVYHKIVHKKGVTGNTLSLFAVPYELLAVKQKSTYKPQEIIFEYDAEEKEVTEEEIQSAYAKLREEAEAKARNAREIVNSDKEFCEIRSEQMNAGSRVEFERVLPRYFKRLAELGLTEEELNPRYNCTLCDDTGQNLDTGQRCLCRERIIKTIKESKFKA